MKSKRKAWFAVLVLGLMLLPTSVMAADVALTDMEAYGSIDDVNEHFSLWQDTGIGLQWSLSNEHVNDGSKSIKVEKAAAAAGWNVLIYTLPETAHKDWTDVEAVSFWLYNASDKELSFAIEIDDGDGDVFEVNAGSHVTLDGVQTQVFSKFINVPGQFKGVIGIPIEHLVNVEWQGRNRELNLENMASIKFGYDPSVYDNVLYLDSYQVHTSGDAAAPAATGGGTAPEPAANPATGDAGAMRYLILGGLSAAALAVLLVSFRKKTTVE